MGDDLARLAAQTGVTELPNEIQLGLIVNPIAGLGGTVALKGTDGCGVVVEALRRGAIPKSGLRAETFLREMVKVSLPFRMICAPGDMGENIARACDMNFSVIAPFKPGMSGAAQTGVAARNIRDAGVDLLIFSGGDGTARDIAAAIGDTIPCLGIPAGVKVYSGVFARTPRAGAKLAVEWLRSAQRYTEIGEIVDLDEEAFRGGHAAVRLHDHLYVPKTPDGRQGIKQSVESDTGSLNNLALEVAVRVDRFEGIVVLGPGGTMAAIAKGIGIEKTLLGVDIVQKGELIVKDASEEMILAEMIEKPALIIVSPLGGQGLVLGRGNQQISPKVIRKAGTAALIIVASPQKLASLPLIQLYVDSGDTELDAELSGPRRVLTGWQKEMVVNFIA